MVEIRTTDMPDANMQYTHTISNEHEVVGVWGKHAARWAVCCNVAAVLAELAVEVQQIV